MKQAIYYILLPCSEEKQTEAGAWAGGGLANNTASLPRNELLCPLLYTERNARQTSPTRLSFAISHSNEYLNRKINILEQRHLNQESSR